MEFEKVLKEVGGFGLFSKTILLAALVLATANSTLFYFFHVYLLIAPSSQWCFVNGTSLEDFPDPSLLPREHCRLISQANGGMNVSVADGSRDTCPTGWQFDSSEFFTTVTMENGWICGESWKTYTVHTAFWTGSMTGFFLSGLLADKIGRKKTALLLIVVSSVCNLLSSFFPEFIGYAVLKFFAAVGPFPVTATIFVLVLEYTIAERRTLIAVVWSVTWSAFGATLPWYAYLLQSWRALIVTNSCLGVILFLSTCWVPESSRWLLSVDRKQDALATLQRIAHINGKNVSEEQLNKMFQETTDDAQAQMSVNKPPTFWQGTALMLKSPNIRKMALLVYLGWFTITLCYNGTAVQLGQLGLDIYTSYSVTVAFELPVNIFCMVSLDILGRRWPNAGFMLLGGVVSIAMWFLRDSSDTWTLVMATTLVISLAAGYNITAQVASELFPTVIRGRAVLLQRMLGDLGSLLGTQVASLAQLDTYIPMLVTGCLSLVASVLVFLLPETAGIPLPQTIEDGERCGKGQGLCFCPLFSRDSDAPANKKSSRRERTRLSLFRKKLPVTRQPAVNIGFDGDSVVVPTIYTTLK